MTFLELCNRVRQESGISGSGPLTVINQQAILAKVVEWVRQADLDIQRLQPTWTFLWRIGSAVMQTDERQYSLLDLGLADTNRIKNMTIGDQPLIEMGWDWFKRMGYARNTDRHQPTAYTYRPDGILMFFPIPDQDYVIEVERSILPTQLQFDDDVSLIPERFHDVIMRKALMYYASHEEDNMLLQVATMRYNDSLAELSAACLPVMKFAPRGFI
ncbi:phage adaptor protein [Arsukibacterium sp.]|uniref:phage adaptor protein n=1 Tax=Arsukibacterium sp. TaxID=1977258 RepID=UPI002FD9CAC5